MTSQKLRQERRQERGKTAPKSKAQCVGTKTMIDRNTGTQTESRCPRFGPPNVYSMYVCKAAHITGYHVCTSSELRDDDISSLQSLLRNHNFRDPYTREELQRDNANRDHVVECQVWAHILNELYWSCEKDILIQVPFVRWLANKEFNLVPVDADINKLKGAGIKEFLDKRTISSTPVDFIQCLKSAHKYIDPTDLDDQDASLGNNEANAIQKEFCLRLKRFKRVIELVSGENEVTVMKMEFFEWLKAVNFIDMGNGESKVTVKAFNEQLEQIKCEANEATLCGSTLTKIEKGFSNKLRLIEEKVQQAAVSDYVVLEAKEIFCEGLSSIMDKTEQATEQTITAIVDNFCNELLELKHASNDNVNAKAFNKQLRKIKHKVESAALQEDKQAAINRACRKMVKKLDLEMEGQSDDVLIANIQELCQSLSSLTCKVNKAKDDAKLFNIWLQKCERKLNKVSRSDDKAGAIVELMDKWEQQIIGELKTTVGAETAQIKTLLHLLKKVRSRIIDERLANDRIKVEFCKRLRDIKRDIEAAGCGEEKMSMTGKWVEIFESATEELPLGEMVDITRKLCHLLEELRCAIEDVNLATELIKSSFAESLAAIEKIFSQSMKACLECANENDKENSNATSNLRQEARKSKRTVLKCVQKLKDEAGIDKQTKQLIAKEIGELLAHIEGKRVDSGDSTTQLRRSQRC